MKQLQNKIQLITYPDSLGGDLKTLYQILKEDFSGVVGGVHILPFYPSSSDRGFSPLTHFEVDSQFGNWKDVQKIGQEFDLMVDFVVNHISSQSEIFQDYLEKGRKSEYRDWFISAEKFSRRIRLNKKIYPRLVRLLEKAADTLRAWDIVFHKGGVNRLTLGKIYRPRPGSPFIRFEFANGKHKNLWCTFSADQVDLDIKSQEVIKYLRKIVKFLARQKVDLVRLDAIGYVAKERDTRSFMIPQTLSFVRWLSEVCHQAGMKSLPEVHSHYTDQFKLAKIKGVDYIYDFALPLLVLDAIHSKNSQSLKRWIKIRPDNQITTLDTHDGLPVPDVEDLLGEKEQDYLVNLVKSFGGNEALRASGYNSNNVDIYQLNCTYYSALGENDNAYIAARAIQFFVPGIPQVYYVGLLAGENDTELLEETGIGRDINRHFYTREDVKRETKRRVVQRLFWLAKFRNSYPAFDGKFKLEKSSEKKLRLFWSKGRCYCRLKVNLRRKVSRVIYWDVDKGEEVEKEL
jgi:sucrose phosphorylase